MRKVENNIVIENARIGFRNFAGEAGTYNPKGNRNFHVFFDDIDLARTLASDGWNIKYLQPREEGDEERAHLQVAVSYTNIPPKVILVTKRNKTILDESTISMLDWAEIINVDLVIQPYNWIVREGTPKEERGVKAYLKTMYVTIREDEFADKYYDVPEGSVDLLANNDTTF